MDLLPGRLGRRRMGGVPWSRAIMFLLAVALAAGVGLAAVGPGPAGPAAGLPSAGLDAVGPIAGPAVFGPIAGASSAALEWPLIVHFFDVDQGDAILFQGEDFTILIDAGRHDRSDVVPHLERAGVDYIDLFIGTHPHADHIGQCAAVVRRFPVGEVWLSGETHTTLTFERCIDAILESEAGYREPRAGEAYQVGSARIEVLHPADLSGSPNNNSIVVRIVYGDVAFLMTGDAELEAELSMLERGHDVTADVLKLGHHGSRTSSSQVFLQAVQPALAVYSAGRDNSYGHPHWETLRTLEKLGITLFGTDVHGTVRVATDGRDLAVFVERVPEGLGAPYWTGPESPGAQPGAKPGAQSAADRAGEPVAGFVLAGGGSGGEPGAGSGGAAGADSRGDAGAGSNGNAGADSVAAAGAPSMIPVCAPPLVNLNTASVEELTRIVHVGPVLAARIVEARPFESVDDLLQVSGIGQARLADILTQGLACVEAP